jgi:DNA invertase Pin-like site-specific DNA recombinase
MRTGTNEQAEKNPLLNYQEDKLRGYCEQNNIEVVKLFKNDNTAKTNKDDFSELLEFAKKNTGLSNLLLFTTWNRLSRNGQVIYSLINQLAEFGIVLQAIEQPISLATDGEAKNMLAFYIGGFENVLANQKQLSK